MTRPSKCCWFRMLSDRIMILKKYLESLVDRSDIQIIIIVFILLLGMTFIFCIQWILVSKRFSRLNSSQTYAVWSLDDVSPQIQCTLVSPSATTFYESGMCLIRYLKSDRIIFHLTSFGTIESAKYTRFLWSVRTINCFPSKYGDRCLTQ